jgi:hypothetical protein
MIMSLARSITFRHWTDIRNEALFNDKVPDIKRAISTPAKADKAIARLWMNEAVLHEENCEPSLNFRKVGRAVNLFLKARTEDTEESRWADNSNYGVGEH